MSTDTTKKTLISLGLMPKNHYKWKFQLPIIFVAFFQLHEATLVNKLSVLCVYVCPLFTRLRHKLKNGSLVLRAFVSAYLFSEILSDLIFGKDTFMA